MKEAEIIKGLRKNNLKCQRAFYELYGPVLMGVCVRYMPTRESAEEVFHDGIMKVYNKINKYNDIGSFKGWCRRLIVNTCLDQLRKDKDNLRLLHIEESEIDIHEEVDLEAELLEEKIEVLMQAITELPKQQKLVLNLFVLDKHSHKEVAQKMSITESASRSLVLRAKRSLKRLLTEEKEFKSNNELRNSLGKK